MTTKPERRLKKLFNDIKDVYNEDVLVVPEFGVGNIDEDLEVISTGSKRIDEALGIGGLPRGRVVEVMGSEGSGKSTLALSVIRQAQEKGFRCGYIDTEQAFDRVRAKQLGVDFEKLAISQLSTAEEALDLLEMMVVSEVFAVIVLDSVAALVPKAEVEGDMSNMVIGLQARLMSKVLRKIVSPVKKTNTLVIFINQLRAKIGGFMPIPMEISAGGNSLKYYASVRMDMRKTGATRTKIPLAKIKVRVKKNKFSIPMQETELKLGEEGFIDG